MKTMKIQIEKTNLSKLEAYALVKRSDGVKASKMRGEKFRIIGYVCSNNSLVDDDTGELTQMKNLTLLTDEGVIIGTNSPMIMRDFDDIMDILADEDVDFRSVTFTIGSGVGKSGNEYGTINIIL